FCLKISQPDTILHFFTLVKGKSAVLECLTQFLLPAKQIFHMGKRFFSCRCLFNPPSVPILADVRPDGKTGIPLIGELGINNFSHPSASFFKTTKNEFE